MVDQSLVKPLAGILSVVQQELAWSELVPIDGFILPHLPHQPVSTKCVNKAERTWKMEGLLLLLHSQDSPQTHRALNYKCTSQIKREPFSSWKAL